VTDDGQKQMITAHLTILRDGRELGKMYPARWLYRKHEQEPVTQVAIRRGFWADLYLVMPGFELKDQSASLQVVINPLVSWIWVGFGLLTVGTAIALLPERAFSFALAHVPDGASTATMLLVFLLLLGSPVAAQHVETGQTLVPIPKTALEKDLYRSLICMCGTCGRQLVGECTCGYAANMREEISRLVRDGKTREQVIQYYIDKYGSQEPLAEPIDRGFNRLAWLLPYVFGATGAVGIGLAAVRWSRRPAREAGDASAVPGASDPEAEARLDDELRELD
jgi:cytochrome c-type biogenesis protein CcmF